MDSTHFLPRRRVVVLATVLLVAAVGCRMRGGRSGKIGPVDADAPADFSTTPSGLKYRILRRSDGPHPTATSDVTVDYVGWLDDGTEFDSSYAGNKPITFNLSEVVAAWTEGIPLVGEGGMIELEVPSHLGYGSRGVPGTIPPGATLHFKVELHNVQ